MLHKFSYLAVLLSILNFSVIGQNLINNGSFEIGTDPGALLGVGAGQTHITNWTVADGGVDYIGTYWTSSDGGRSLDMSRGTAGTISQVVTLNIGQTYTLFFDLAGNAGGLPVIKTLQVNITGQGARNYTFDTTGYNTANMGWRRESFTFTATNISTTVSFTSMDAATAGPALDNVYLFEESVANGSFEIGTAPGASLTVNPGGNDVTNWTVSIDNIDYIGTAWTASEGNRSIDVAGTATGGTIEQTVTLNVGDQYTLFFDMAGDPGGGPTIKTVQVNITGEASQNFTFDTTGFDIANMGWTVKSYTFAATNAGTNISFTSLDATTFGPAIDNVFLVKVALAIELLSFTAEKANKHVKVKWQTGSETSNAGFYVLRSTNKENGYVRLNKYILPAKGSPVNGASYLYEDFDAEPGISYFYKLEDVDYKGKITVHGPVKVK